MLPDVYRVLASVSMFANSAAFWKDLLLPPRPPGKSNGALAESLSLSANGAPDLSIDASNRLPITLSTLAVLNIFDISLVPPRTPTSF